MARAIARTALVAATLLAAAAPFSEGGVQGNSTNNNGFGPGHVVQPIDGASLEAVTDVIAMMLSCDEDDQLEAVADLYLDLIAHGKLFELTGSSANGVSTEYTDGEGPNANVAIKTHTEEGSVSSGRDLMEVAKTMIHEAGHVGNMDPDDGIAHDPTVKPDQVGESTARQNHAVLNAEAWSLTCRLSCCQTAAIAIGCDGLLACFDHARAQLRRAFSDPATRDAYIIEYCALDRKNALNSCCCDGGVCSDV
ncbi:MAG: hypothetical protein H6831_01250 [Planctomycetes bacterium]|nr:hypothetical protein [Planctomycetota bacterium]